jgi:hypothetical protein
MFSWWLLMVGVSVLIPAMRALLRRELNAAALVDVARRLLERGDAARVRLLCRAASAAFASQTLARMLDVVEDATTAARGYREAKRPEEALLACLDAEQTRIARALRMPLGLCWLAAALGAGAAAVALATTSDPAAASIAGGVLASVALHGLVRGRRMRASTIPALRALVPILATTARRAA